MAELKFIFESEEEKDQVIHELATSNICPSTLRLNDDRTCGDIECNVCWKNSISYEIKAGGDKCLKKREK